MVLSLGGEREGEREGGTDTHLWLGGGVKANLHVDTCTLVYATPSLRGVRAHINAF